MYFFRFYQEAQPIPGVAICRLRIAARVVCVTTLITYKLTDEIKM